MKKSIHRHTLRFARRNMTQEEISSHKSPFNSYFWNTRSKAIRDRLIARIAKNKKRAERRQTGSFV